MIQSVILLVVLIGVNAIFASAEIAVISVNETKLKKMAEDGDKRAKRLQYLVEQPSRFLSTIQVPITMAGFLQGAFAAENFAGPLVGLLVSLGVTIPESVLRSVCIVVLTIILSYFNLIFGELVPKRVAMKKSESLCLALSGLLYTVARICSPLVGLLSISTNGVLRLIGLNPEEEEDSVTEEEIRMMLMEGDEKGVIQSEENEIIQNVFEFNDISVEELCTHRRDAVILYASDSPEEWEQTIKGSRHTYYPVCGEDQDDIVGVLDTKDYFRLSDRSKDNIMKNAVDKAFFVPEGMKANVLFRQMKEYRIYFAVIIDEYGGMSGIITLHDLMESLVGDLNEKEDPVLPEDIEKVSEDTWRIQGCADLEEVGEKLGREMPTDDFETFSGFVCGMIGRIPKDGESFTWEGDGLKVLVKDVRNHIIQETMVQLLAPAASPAEEA